MVAFVQCAGSRDENHLPFCSGICCMASMKQATYVREQYPEAKIYIFFIDIRATDRLLNALCALGYLFKEGDKFINTGVVSDHLVKGKPGYISGLHHTANLWENWSRLTDVVRAGKPATDAAIKDRGDSWLEAFIEAIKEHQPNIVGMSALLTTTMRSMGHTIKAIAEAGLRDQIKIMVGGAPVDAEFADRIGADGYGSNAPAAADLAKEFVGVA